MSNLIKTGDLSNCFEHRTGTELIAQSNTELFSNLIGLEP